MRFQRAFCALCPNSMEGLSKSLSSNSFFKYHMGLIVG